MTTIVLDFLKIQNLSDSCTLSQNQSKVSLGTPNFVRKINFQNVLFNTLILLKQTKLQDNKRLDMSLVSNPLNTIYNTMRTTKYLFPKKEKSSKISKVFGILMFIILLNYILVSASCVKCAGPFFPLKARQTNIAKYSASFYKI